ncbi:MAG: PmeII family type II restriction endonuclease [Actinomycetota bacterium]
MHKLNKEDIEKYIKKNLSSLQKSRIAHLSKLRLKDVLKRKNPYLFKTLDIKTPEDMIRILLDARLSSREETIFGDFLEQLAIFINKKIYNGNKSSSEGIDLEFNKDNKRYIVSIKSGPNWGNSQQIERLKDNFRKAKRRLRTSKSNIEVIAVNGCCYGKCKNKDKGDYFMYCGQEFWQLISGEENLYTEIIEPLGYIADGSRNVNFNEQYLRVLEKFTKEFNKNFCDSKGEIDWEKIVEFNSKKA